MAQQHTAVVHKLQGQLTAARKHAAASAPPQHATDADAPSRLVEAYPPGYFSMKGKRTVSAPVSKPRRLDDHLSARSRSRASPWNTTDDEAERTDDV